jgi:hypothetical protein
MRKLILANDADKEQLAQIVGKYRMTVARSC